MPHSRSRFALPSLKKKLRFFPVVAIQGARQTGKSFLARDLLVPEIQHAAYVSLDHLSLRQEAQLAPHTFLTAHQKNDLLIIDEAQKVPDIFDAVKHEVDQQRTPGRFLLLGSTEFSRLALIRESLTGRMGRIRLFPMTLGETVGTKAKHADFTRAQTMKYLSSGGMPGIFSVRDDEQKDALFQDWIDLTCLRDLQQFKSLKLDSELAYSILKLAATLEDPTRTAMSRALRVDPRKIGSHLTALCELFVLMKLNPHPSGTGKPIYLPLDTGVAAHLGAPLLRRLHIWLAIERMAYNQYFEKKRKTF